jgi:glyoxylate reductase
MPARILITQQIPDEGLALLRSASEASLEINPAPGAIWTAEELRARVPGHDYLLCLLTDQIDAALLEAGARGSPPLRLVANMAVGYNNIDLEAARRLGILVTNTPGVLTEATADLTWALLLAVARRIPEADRFTRAGRFTGWQPLLLLGAELTGKTLGIVGMGRIGRAVARRATGFGMSILYTNRRPLSSEEERALNASFAPLEEVLRRSDILSLHVPYTPQTHHLLNAETLALLKPGAYLINTARGPIVDEAALVAALQAGHLRGAALDVFEDEPRIHPALLQMEQVVLAPHIGSATRETRALMATTAAANILAHLRGETPPNLVS